MAQFLTTAGISARIEEIIAGAKSQVVLACPYWDLSEILYDRLKDADRRKVKIALIYGKQELKDQVMAQFAELGNLNLYFCDNLHAKCYFNEDLMVITSMNMLEFSERKNREMGILITSKQDKDLFDAAVKEVKSIMYSSEKVELSRVVHGFRKQERVRTNQGFCIRCGERIRYDSKKPYCKDCYSVWADFENPFYKESCCHRCGKPAPTSMYNPLCYPCYQSGD